MRLAFTFVCYLLLAVYQLCCSSHTIDPYLRYLAILVIRQGQFCIIKCTKTSNGAYWRTQTSGLNVRTMNSHLEQRYLLIYIEIPARFRKNLVLLIKTMEKVV